MKYGTRSLKTLNGIHPYLIWVLMEAINDSPYDYTITNGVRTTKEQQALYAQGRTTKGPIVTNTDGIRNKSNHQVKDDGFGYAVDLYPYVNGAVDVENKSKRLKPIADHIMTTANRLGVKIRWGGNFKSLPDAPHFELVS